MSIRQNKASRVNRGLLLGMMFLAVVVFGSVFALLYLSYQKPEATARETDFYEISLSQAFKGDSLIVSVNDSILFSGIMPTSVKTDMVFHAEGSKEELSMMSIADLSAGKTLNENLPEEPSKIFIEKTDGISIRTEKKL